MSNGEEEEKLITEHKGRLTNSDLQQLINKVLKFFKLSQEDS